jgi:histidyl-tRNA synthetase
MQFDADTVGTDNIAADAEICMLAADTMEALGFQRGDYVIKVNSRKVLDGVLEIIGLGGPEHAATRLTVLRAVDKLDRLGIEGVRLLLGPGRRDESGDFTKGAGLSEEQIELVVSYLTAQGSDGGEKLARVGELVGKSAAGEAGVADLMQLLKLCDAAGYAQERIAFDPSVVRGLEYYTGPVFEAELTFQMRNEEGQVVRFGSVGGGGRYDDLVARFTGQRVPATGFSIGVSRLQAAIASRGQIVAKEGRGPVVVLVMDRDELPRYQRFVQQLRAAKIPAELYLGTAGMKAQMKYADRRGSPCVVIQGGDERAKGEVQIKDLIEGARLAATITDAKEWREARPAQFSVPEAELVSAVQSVLARHGLS